MMALTQADKELMQANNRIALLERTLRDTERELLRAKAENEELLASLATTEKFI
jgi:hypothetical protein